jgi:hypothetical protein
MVCCVGGSVPLVDPFMRKCSFAARKALPATLVWPLIATLGGCASVQLPAPAPVAVSQAPFVPAFVPALVPATGTTPAPGAASPALAGSATGAPALSSRALATLPTPLVPPGTPPSFAVVTKDAKKIDGPLVLWQKDDKVWIELPPAQFNQPFLLSPKLKSGIGEAMLLGGLMAYPINGAGGAQVVEFVRIHNQVRLQARNTAVVASAGTPEERGLQSSYSASLLGSVPVASQPHPDNKSVLIEANGLFLSDMLGVGMSLQRAFRQGYALDRANTVITAARGSAQATVIETLNHYYTASPASSPAGLPPGALAPTLPRFLADTRSLLVGHHYSLAPMPAVPMATRAADPRVGLFTSTVLDFSNDLQITPRQRLINRWRLEKKDPAAEFSEPVKPITFWIDRNVPLQYRDTVRAGILEWNKAFEKIGFRNALVVQQQSDDADFDTLDFGVASVRWLMSAEPTFGAIGPRHVDPRTGEILDADIGFEAAQTRAVRGTRVQVLGAQSQISFAAPFDALADPANAAAHADHSACQHGALAAEQMGYALDVLQARGEIEPDSPQAQQFVLDYVKDTIMHEVGHTLGLRHNFRASRVYTEAQLSDPEFTRVNGTTGSVMEYNALNLSRPGQPAGVPFQTTLGPYDYWAIEYAYKTLPPGAPPEAERKELQRVAARSNEPLLAFGTDEDNFFGIDPETIQLDLGADPVVFAAKRLDIARDLFRRQETRELSPTRDYAVLRRSIGFALADVTRAVGVLTRQIGGVRTLRDFPGSGRDPLLPVPAAVQRKALDLMAGAVLAADGLSLSPALQRRLAPDFLDRGETLSQPTDYGLPQRMLDLQRAVLNYLMSDNVAARILDSVAKFDRAGDAFALSEVYARLSRDIWSELGSRAPAGLAITAPRRELQREHVNRVAGALLRPSPQARADARGLLREQAQALLVRLDNAARRTAGSDAETRAHLADSSDTLRQALQARSVRTAP